MDRLQRQQFFKNRMADWEPEDVDAHTALEQHLQRLGHAQSLVVPASGEREFNRSLVRRGVMSGGDAQRIPGATSQCHSNSARCASEDPDTELWSGVAKSDDDLWRSHSWIRRGGQIHETTEPRTAYFGRRLEGDERQQFIDDNA